MSWPLSCTAKLLAKMIADIRCIGDVLAASPNDKEATAQAIAIYQAVMPVALKIEALRDAAACYFGFAGLAIHLSKLSRARELTELALDLYRTSGNKNGVERCVTRLKTLENNGQM